MCACRKQTNKQKKLKHVWLCSSKPLWISYDEKQECVLKHAHKPTEWTPLQNTWAILNRDAEEESNIYVDKWMEFFCCCFFQMELKLDRKPTEYLTTVDSRVHALMRRLVVFLSNSKRTRGGSAMSCCCACYIKSVWPRDDSMEKNNLIGSSSAAKSLLCPSFPAYPALTSHGGGMARMKEGLLDRSPVCVSSISFPARPILAGWVFILTDVILNWYGTSRKKT